ncbi:hypothetical protein [Porcipelethomonas sp.]|uniref:hypothetical protein n=1 Tax=Porcipelethomonas sp. TaxID=2981675 RepID=UPI003EF9FD8B
MTDTDIEKINADEQSMKEEPENPQENNWKKFKILVIIFVILTLIYMILHLCIFAGKKSDSVSKTHFTESEMEILENETGITVPENAYISDAELQNDASWLKVWITGIENCESFISECTEYEPEDYESLNPKKYGSSRYYTSIRNGESEPLECYIYKNSGDDKWTAYIIDNNVDIKVKSIF